MSKCTTEKLTMLEISNALNKMSHFDKKIVVPRFQRGKRWNADQENKLIDSIVSGYPVGTLLFYKTIEIDLEGKSTTVYTLVDGLQRSTAIKRYICNPTQFFGEENISEETLDLAYKAIGIPGQEKIIKDKIKKAYIENIKQLDDYNNAQFYSLARCITNDIPPAINKDIVVDTLIDIFKDSFKIWKDWFNNIANTPIPAVVYTGAEENLPEIFNRINSQGTPLNTFEIYAASWPLNETYYIDNDEIVDRVLEKYDVLNDDTYTIKGYNREDLRKNKKLTIFEYVFGYSKWLTKTYSILGFEKKDKPDEITQIGFDILDACLHDSKNIGELYKKLKIININKLERRINECIKFIDGIISPVVKFKGNKRKEDNSLLFSKNQVVSLIAFVFKEKYKIEDLSERLEWLTNKEKLKKNLLFHFVYDVISKEWFEGGGKIHTVINSKRYYEEISSSAWESVLNTMFEESLNKKETSSVRKPSSVDIIFLNCIYMTKFTAMDQSSLDKFDIEHIATKDIMKSLINRTKSLGLPIGSVANLCYLPEHENRGKGRKTLYDYDFNMSQLTLEEIEEKFSFTTKQDLEWVMEEMYEQGDDEILREYYIDYLKTRFENQKNQFYKSMSIDQSSINKSWVEEITQKNKKLKSIDETKAGKERAKDYQIICNRMESKFDCSFEFINRTSIVSKNGDVGVVMAYSKLYQQGNKNKYWFAYHPEKIEKLDSTNKYYAFQCSHDNVTILLSHLELEERKDMLNYTEGEGSLYYHIVYLIYKNGDVKWFLSKPKNIEVPINSNCIRK